MLEIFRRVAALSLICLGGFLIVCPGGELLIVEIKNFRPGFEKEVRKYNESIHNSENGLNAPLIPKSAPPSYREYITSKTKGNEVDVSGLKWIELARKLGSPAEHSELESREYGFRHMRYIFSPDEPPFDEVTFQPGKTLYLQVNGKYWLRARSDFAGNIYGLPDKYLYPYFVPGLAMLILGFILYFVLPKPQFEEDEIHYPRGATVIGPDMLGLVLTPVFFLLPILIVQEIDSGASILSISKGWIWLTAAMWLLAAICLTFIFVALKFSTLRFRISKEGFSQIRGEKEKLIRWEDMEYYQNYRTKISRRLSTLLLIFGTTVQTIGLGVILRGQEEHGIYLYDKDGSRIKVMSNSLDEFDDIVRALKERGIKRRFNRKNCSAERGS